MAVPDETLSLLFSRLENMASSNPKLVNNMIESISGLFSQPEDLLQPDKLDEHVKRATLESISTQQRYLTTFQEQVAEIEFFHLSIDDLILNTNLIEDHLSSALRLSSETIRKVPPNFQAVKQISTAYKNSLQIKSILAQINNSDTEMKRVLYLLQKEQFFLDKLTQFKLGVSGDQKKDISAYLSVPIGSHLNLIYIRLFLLLNWKEEASLECQNIKEGQLSSQAQSALPFTKNLIRHRLEIFFNPLSEIVGLLKSYWLELLNHVVKIQTIECCKIYDPYPPNKVSVILKGGFNPFSIPWYEMYCNLLGAISKIIRAQMERSKSVKLREFINPELFFSTWNHNIKANTTDIFNEHRIELEFSKETLVDLLGKIDGPYGLGFIAWIYLYAMPSFQVLYQDQLFGVKMESMALLFLSELRSNLKKYFSNTNLLEGLEEKQTSISIPPADILFFISWIEIFSKRIKSILLHAEADGSLVVPDLLDEKEISLLIKKYVKHTTMMVKEWLQNLATAELQKIKLRLEPPETDRFGKFFVSVTGEVFLFLEQVLQLAVECQNLQLFPLLIDSILGGALGAFQKTMLDAYKKEMTIAYTPDCLHSPFASGKNPEDNPPGLDYYAISLINSTVQWEKDLEHIKEIISPSYDTTLITKSLHSSKEEFEKLRQLGLLILNCSIFSDIMPIIKSMYTSYWYNNANDDCEAKPIEIICDTIDDFLSDYECRMDLDVFQTFCVEFFDLLIIAILKRMVHKYTRFRVDIVEPILSNDHNELAGVYGKFVKNCTASVLKHLENVYSLITSNEKTIMVAIYNFYTEYPDTPISFFEEIISKRDDLDKSVVKKIMVPVKDHITKAKKNCQTSQPSIFTKV